MKYMVILITLILSYMIKPTWASYEQKIFINKIKGNVTIINFNGQKIVDPKVGDELFTGQTVKTWGNSIVILKMGKSIIKIGQKSNFLIEGLYDPQKNVKKNSFFLKVGSILTNYLKGDDKEETLEIKTQQLAMGIRGTKFMVHQDLKTSMGLLVVKNGTVVATNKKGESQNVSANQALNVSPEGDLNFLKEFQWMEKFNWNEEDDKSGGIFEESDLNNIIQSIIKSSSNPSVQEMKYNLDVLFFMECEEKSNADACAYIAGKSNESKELYLGACQNSSTYACYRIGNMAQVGEEGIEPIDIPNLRKSISNINKTNEEEIDESDTIAQLEKKCFKGNHLACFDYGLKNDDYSLKRNEIVQLGTGYKHQLAIILGQNCKVNNPFACKGLVNWNQRLKLLTKGDAERVALSHLSKNLLNTFKQLNEKLEKSMSYAKEKQKLTSSEQVTSDPQCEYISAPEIITAIGDKKQRFCYGVTRCDFNDGMGKMEGSVACNTINGIDCPVALDCAMASDVEIIHPSNSNNLYKASN